jgi:iron complex outermembrane receptor protein
VKSWTTVDASATWAPEEGPAWLKDLRVTLSATNLFDKDPPVVLNGTFSWDTQAHSALGRMVAVEVSKRW